MTKAQQKKLDTIIGKLEALQSDCVDKSRKESEAMAEAKKRLMEIMTY